MTTIKNIDQTSAPNGCCPAKLARQIKKALNLPKKPKIVYWGTPIHGSDNLETGTMDISIDLDESQSAIVDGLIASQSKCKGNDSRQKPDAGIDYDDLDDHLPGSFPGNVIYVQDLDRLNGQGKGCLVYRAENAFRRVSNDEVVWPK